MKILAIDPGPIESAFVEWDGNRILDFGKIKNDDILDVISYSDDYQTKIIIEQVRSYGMPVGAEVFDTVHWSGRFHQEADNNNFNVHLIPRKEVKIHLCGNMRAKDSNIIQALVDRFAYGQKNKGKGTKKEPGFFYGFKSDIWQAFALAVTYYDTVVTEVK